MQKRKTKNINFPDMSLIKGISVTSRQTVICAVSSSTLCFVYFLAIMYRVYNGFRNSINHNPRDSLKIWRHALS